MVQGFDLEAVVADSACASLSGGAEARRHSSNGNPMQISLVENERLEEVAAEIERELLRSLARINVQSNNSSFALEIKNNLGELLGGLTASTSYGWLLIRILWVREDLRGKGLGRQLMAAAEARGRDLGCHGAWLDTSSAEARQFYLKLGYDDFGLLQNTQGQFPEGHARWFMKRDLTSN